MAVVANQQQEQDKDQQQQGGMGQPQLGSGGSTGSPQGLNTTPGQGQGNRAAAPGGAAGSQRKGSGRFTNIQRYIQANQGAGQQLGSRIQNVAQRTQDKGAGQREQQLGQIRGNIQQEQQRVGQAGDLAQQIAGGTTEQLQQLAGQRAQDIAQLRTGQSGIGDIQSQTQQLGQELGQVGQQLGDLAQQSRTEQGRFGLLRQAVGGPRYGMGQRRLDALLLQGSGSDALANLQQDLSQRAATQQAETQQLQQQLGQDIGATQQQIGQAQQQIQQALGGFGAEGGGALGDIYGQLAQQQQQAQQTQAQELSTLQDELRGLEDTQEQIKLSDQLKGALGLEGGEQLFGLNLRDYASQLQAGDTDITLADVAQQEQMDRLGALRTLAGIEDPIERQIGLREGTAGATFDQDKLMSDIDRARKTFFDEAQKNVLTGKGSKKWVSGDFFRGGKGIESATAQANVADLLEEQGISYGRRGDKSQSFGTDLVDTLYTDTGIIGGILGAAFGKDPKKKKAKKAQQQAREMATKDLQRQYQDYLRRRGFYRTIG